MPDDAGSPLDYGRQTPTPPSMRWLILLIVWTVGLVIWVAYFLLIAFMLVQILL
jgi:hypothetical protein